EAGADSLDAVTTRLAAGDDRRSGRLDRERLEVWVVLANEASDAGDRAPGADAGDDRVDLMAGIFPNFRSGRRFVDRRVGRVLELLRHPSVRRARDKTLRFGDRRTHAFRRRSQNEIG